MTDREALEAAQRDLAVEKSLRELAESKHRDALALIRPGEMVIDKLEKAEAELKALRQPPSSEEEYEVMQAVNRLERCVRRELGWSQMWDSPWMDDFLMIAKHFRSLRAELAAKLLEANKGGWSHWKARAEKAEAALAERTKELAYEKEVVQSRQKELAQARSSLQIRSESLDRSEARVKALEDEKKDYRYWHHERYEEAKKKDDFDGMCDECQKIEQDLESEKARTRAWMKWGREIEKLLPRGYTGNLPEPAPPQAVEPTKEKQNG